MYTEYTINTFAYAGPRVPWTCAAEARAFSMCGMETLFLHKIREHFQDVLEHGGLDNRGPAFVKLQNRCRAYVDNDTLRPHRARFVETEHENVHAEASDRVWRAMGGWRTDPHAAIVDFADDPWRLTPALFRLWPDGLQERVRVLMLCLARTGIHDALARKIVSHIELGHGPFRTMEAITENSL